MDGKDARPLIFIACTAVISMALCLWCFANNYFIIIQNLLYIPIIIACIYYANKGLLFSFVIALIYLALLAFFSQSQVIILGGIIRCVIFMGIGLTVSALSQKIKNRDKDIQEKEMLLREIHHRVKNNMAQIQSLLQLQAGSASSSEAKTALQESVTRIQTMSVLYENLLLSEDCQALQIKTYVDDLIDSISAVLNQDGKISVHTKISDFTTDAKTANILGIIINELITNAFKYAFLDRSEGTITVVINRNKNTVTLTIQDNGAGYTETSCPKQPAGIGRTIVKMLTEKLNGTYIILNEAGTKNIITFQL